jgi:benzaldehyde dehydrogenase (NAD)
MSLLNIEEMAAKIFTGQWTTAHGGDAPVVNPSTGQEIGRAGSASAADVAEACERAAQAQKQWAATAFAERVAIVHKAGRIIEENGAEIISWFTQEAGAGSGMAGFNVHVGSAECYEAAALASQPYGDLLRSEKPRLSFSRQIPVGVVGVISPFNAPLILGIRSVAPALALGNAVVLKPDPRTAVCGGAVIAEAFRQAGLPEGVLHVVPGGVAAGEQLVADPNVGVVAFTGSSNAGRKIAEAASRHLKRTHLELGGNSPLIILDDVDVDVAASNGAWSAFLHQGQICMVAGRHIVHESVADEYVAKLAEKADNLPVGDPSQGEVALGPIIDAAQRDKIHALVTSSVDGGAQLAAGGTYEGLFYRPTVLDRVTKQTPAYCTEVFGPVASVIRFSSVDELAALAADSEYGLTLGILTRNPMKGLEIADRIPSGIVHINDQTIDDEAVAPFGGVGASGNGSRVGGRANLEAFTETQWVTMQAEPTRYPF